MNSHRTIERLGAWSPEDLADAVLVFPSVVSLSPEETAALIRGMELLRDAGFLTELRGGRKTELARPLSGRARAFLDEFGQGVKEAILRIEAATRGSGFFLRTLKLDHARASSTQADTELGKPNFHFDYPRSSLREYPGGNPQFYLNLGQETRTFRFVPLPLTDVLDAVARPHEPTDQLPAQTAADRYAARLGFSPEEVRVEHGTLAAFDGRRFMHDAGKGTWASNGTFTPSAEPDIVAALDLASSPTYGLYDPARPFLKDVRD